MTFILAGGALVLSLIALAIRIITMTRVLRAIGTDEASDDA